MSNIRIGQGFDVHKLVENRKLILCGVEIPYELGLLGHSDADVAIHALMDGILGALALNDIGTLFPDNDEKYHNIDSTKLLSSLLALKEVQKWEIGNVDITIIAQKPKIAPFRVQMRERLQKILNIPLTQISVKATTTEKLGFIGRGEGIAALAVVLMQEKN